MEAAVHPHQGTRLEGSQPQGGDVELPMHLGVGREQHLEAAVEAVAVDVVGADPATHPVAGLEDHHRPAGPGEHPGGGEPGQPGPDDRHVGSLGQRADAHAATCPGVAGLPSRARRQSSSSAWRKA